MLDGLDRAAAIAAGMDADRLDALVTFLDHHYIQSGKLPHMQFFLSRDEVPLLSVTRGAARVDDDELVAEVEGDE